MRNVEDTIKTLSPTAIRSLRWIAHGINPDRLHGRERKTLLHRDLINIDGKITAHGEAVLINLQRNGTKQ